MQRELLMGSVEWVQPGWVNQKLSVLAQVPDWQLRARGKGGQPLFRVNFLKKTLERELGVGHTTTLGLAWSWHPDRALSRFCKQPRTHV